MRLMNQLLSRIHARVGDLWWYSAMIFLACRFGDVINAFIGLWLVPKYVGPQELGAVLPLQQLSTFFTIPLAIIATVFAKYVNTYATRGEFGKVKSFVRDVLSVSSAVFVVCIVGAYLMMPFFCKRLNVVSGSLTVLVLASGFLANVSQLFSNALQGLKRFNVMSLTGLIVAPIRLVTMLVAMPVRALSGYMLGQTTPSAAAAAIAAWDLHRGLKAYKVDTSWRNDWREMVKYTWPIAVNLVVGAFCATVNQTIYRQRLPEIESGAFYLITRFAEVANFTGASTMLVVFPLASEAHERGDENRTLLYKAAAATLIGTIALTLAFALFHQHIFGLTSAWTEYAPLSHLLPIVTFYTGCSMLAQNFMTYEIACRRFSAMYAIVIQNVIWNAFLVIFTGAEFFRGQLPDDIVNWMASIPLAKLDVLTYTTCVLLLMQLVVVVFLFWRNARNMHTYKF